MNSGGNLAPHMHKEGWLSGSTYLQRPKKKLSNDGDIEFGLHGGDYPSEGKEYPSKIVDINKGSIVVFPSSLFHSTPGSSSVSGREPVFELLHSSTRSIKNIENTSNSKFI